MVFDCYCLGGHGQNVVYRQAQDGCPHGAVAVFSAAQRWQMAKPDTAQQSALKLPVENDCHLCLLSFSRYCLDLHTALHLPLIG